MKRTFSQIVHEFLEEGMYALAMNYAAQRGDFEMLRSFEEKIH